MGWKTRFIGFLATISALCSHGRAVDENVADSRSSTTSCGNDPANDRFLMLVSTLDGQFSALDIRNKGQLLWSVNADSRPLLSSSISKVEYKKDGSQVRLIPSLDGALFQYDGESIEAVPFTAEKLLSTTFRLNDKMMIIGGKEICSYGIHVATGKMQYACTANACHTFDDDNASDDEDIVVVTRNTKTVRAVDSRTGAESWNFSVGQHDVLFLKGETNKIESESKDDDGINIYTCPPSATELDDDEEERRIKVVVPDGLIVSLNPENAKGLDWKYKFTSPIAGAWLLHQGDLKQINLFSDTNVPALSSYQPPDEIQLEPLLYVGMHMNQPYVQASSQMQADISEAADSFDNSMATVDVPRISWKPYLSTATSRTPLLSGNREPDIPMVDRDKNRAKKNDNALVTRQENYPFDQGYYLFPDYTPARRSLLLTDNSTKTLVNSYMPISVWTWWKHILATSAVMTIIIHVVLTHYIWKDKIHELRTTHSSENATAQTTVYKVESETSASHEKIETARQDSDYVSRYQSDFEHIQCLGKGGFGVVFQAKNRVDDCHYAVKRIPIPCSESSKEKVMREVKVLAKLEHVGIVRFFHAWVESPPLGWQEERDQDIEDSECLTPTPCNSGEAYSNELIKMPPNIGNPFRPFELDESNFNVSNSKGHMLSSKNSASGSFSFSQDILENDESGSFSFDPETHGRQNPLSFDNEDSFQIDFHHSSADESTSWSPNDRDMHIPFSNHERSVQNNDSVNVFLLDDSGCADKCNDDESIVFETNDAASHDNRSARNWAHGQFSKANTINSSLASYSTTGGRRRSHLPEKDITFAPKLYLFIQMQLCKRETLKDWLSANTLNRPRAHVFDIFDQIVNAVTYVHDLGLMHRDLKPSNIFFSAEGVIKVGDFGLVTALTEEEDRDNRSNTRSVYRKHTDQVGTQLYMSTEQIAGKVYTSKVDIFSLGMILFELLYPFATQMERIDNLIRVKRSKLPERFCREMPMEADCVLWLVSPDPDDRPTARQIQESDLLAQFEQRHRITNRYRTVSSSSNGSSEIG